MKKMINVQRVVFLYNDVLYILIWHWGESISDNVTTAT